MKEIAVGLFVLAVFLSGAPALAGMLCLLGLALLVIAWWP